MAKLRSRQGRDRMSMVKSVQVIFLGNPEYGCELEAIDFASFAHPYGAQGFTIDDPAQCGATLDQALETPSKDGEIKP